MMIDASHPQVAPAHVDRPVRERSIDRRVRIVKWILVVVAAAWVLHTVSGIFIVGIQRTAFMRHKVGTGFIEWSGWRHLLVLHAGAAAIAVGAGTAGVCSQLTRRWRWHRLIGKIYVISVLLSAIAGVPLALTATGGLVSAIGFLVLTSLWSSTTLAAYLTARRQEFDRHRIWIFRSYALTWANTSLHLLLVPLTRLIGDRTDAYRLAIWLCFVVNLALVECYLYCNSDGGLADRHGIRKSDSDIAASIG